jgi:RNA polymerase sigma-70 factor (ECF subfamily)
MLAVAVSLLGHHHDSEDAVQEACIQAMRRIGDVRDPAAVRAWLIAIVANGCRAQLRRVRPETTSQLSDLQSTALDSAEQILERSAVRDWVQVALDGLPEALRTVILLRYFSNASSYRTIAELCDVPVGTVRSRLHSARAQLADQLLATAAIPHRTETSHRRLAEGAGRAMSAFQATGDATHLADCFATNLRFTLADGVHQSGRDRFAALLADDFTKGVRSQPIRITAGADVTVVELRLINPTDHPMHCPPGLTQLHFHNGRQVQRIASHYALDPNPPTTRGAAPARPGYASTGM